MAAPDLDEILAKGRKRQKKLELGSGIVLLAAGLGCRLWLESVTDGGFRFLTYGSVGLGITLIVAGLFGTGRGA